MDPLQILFRLGSVARIIGIGIALVQLCSLRTQRQEELVIRAYAPFLDTELTRAWWRVHPEIDEPSQTSGVSSASAEAD